MQMNNILNILCEKKIENIKVIDVRSVQTLFDYFIIGASNSMNQSMACIEELDKIGLINHTEIDEKGDWVLIDCSNFVVHLFSARKRKEIDLEYLWKDMPLKETECK